MQEKDILQPGPLALSGRNAATKQSWLMTKLTQSAGPGLCRNNKTNNRSRFQKHSSSAATTTAPLWTIHHPSELPHHIASWIVPANNQAPLLAAPDIAGRFPHQLRVMARAT